MKKLVKIKLINWHLFTNEEIIINGNTLLTGENGSGKSTLLDALQYVLTAGKMNFNSAANDSNKRTLNSYVRGKLGIEDKEFIRNNDVNTHIALEYLDEKTKTYQVIGAIITLSSSNTRKETFYQLVDARISDKLYLNNNKVLDYTGFKKVLRNESIRFIIKDTKGEARGLFRQALGVDKHYFDLVPKALAFKPINELYKFIFEFLLNEENIMIEKLRNNIRRYRELDNILRVSQQRLIYLEDINEAYQKYQKNNHVIESNLLRYNYLENKYLTKVIKDSTNSINNNNRLIENCEIELNNYQISNEKLIKEETRISNALSENETYKYKLDLEQSKISIEVNLSNVKRRYNCFIENLSSEEVIYKKLKIGNKINELLAIDVIEYENVYRELEGIKDKITAKHNQYTKEKTLLDLNYMQESDKLKDLKTKLLKLENNKFAYSSSVNLLVNELNTKLGIKYNELFDIKPVCEYVEVKEEKWRNALEGYLNSQRFDIIVDAKYFKDAIIIYDELKKQKPIYGVGLVDIAKLNDLNVISNSLAAKVETTTNNVRLYLNMLLNNVICVDDITKLNTHRIAINDNCMYYQNYTIRALNPKIYQKPYLGQQAIKIQIGMLKSEILTIETNLKELNTKILNNNKYLDLLKTTNTQAMISECYIINDYQQVNSDLLDLNKKLDAIKIDDSWITLENNLKEVIERKQQNIIQRDLLGNKKYQLIRDNEQLNVSIKEAHNKYLSSEIELIILKNDKPHLYHELSLELDKQLINSYNYQSALKNLEQSILKQQNKVAILELSVLDKMNQFNNYSNLGFDNNIESIVEYQDYLFKIRDLEIVKLRDSIKEAKIKCELTFQEDFVSKLKSKIDIAKTNIKKLNKNLAQTPFNGDTFEFVVSASKKPAFKDYYNIIMSDQDFYAQNLFSATLSQKNQIIMNELFEKLTAIDDDNQNEKLLSEYVDYRNYMHYDIKITHANGDVTYFSKVSREKSGGETQTPFYVIIASSFEQLINKNAHNETGCVVLFDEAFNNMDESRIETMMQFYTSLNMQIILAVPPGRIPTIYPHMSTGLIVYKENNQSYIRAFTNHE